MKKVLAIVLIALCAFSVFAKGSEETKGTTTEKVRDVYFTIGTAGTAGALYPMGIAMAQTLTDHIPGYVVTGEATAASIANIKGLKDGSFKMAISQTEVASLAYRGIGDYAGNAVPELRALFSTIYNYLQVFTVEGKGIEKINDLKGKTVSLGAAGSGGQMMAKILLESYGITLKDLNAQYMSDSDGVASIKDGKIDAMFVTNPLKSASLIELTGSVKAKMIPVENDAFYKAVPAYTKWTLPAGTYQGIDVDITIPKARIIMCTTADAFTEEEAYRIVKTIWENRSEWSGSAKAVERDVLLETALEEIDIPLHPGAIKYFEEIGMTVPESLKK